MKTNDISKAETINIPFIYENLSNINGIKLTKRQIDVAACLISHKKRKIICKILGISLSAFFEHCNKLKLLINYSVYGKKLDIVEFFETSDKYNYLQDHYWRLVINHSFEKMLGVIGEKRLCSKSLNIECSETSYKCKEIIKIIKKHLKIACIRYDINGEIGPESKKILITSEGVYKKTSIKNISDYIIIFIEKDSSIIKNNDYYCAIYRLLKIACSSEQTERLYIEFIKQQKAYENNFLTDKNHTSGNFSKNISPMQKVGINNQFNWIKSKYKKISVTIIVIGFVVGVISKNTIINISKDEKKKHIIKTYLPPRNIMFTGRNDILDLIKKNLDQNNFGVITQTIAGSGGIGKTQLAIEYAYRGLSDRTYDTIVWLVGESSCSLDRSYQAITKKSQIDTKGLSELQIREEVHKILLGQNISKKVLFVLDNVKSERDIQKYLLELHNQWPVNIAPHVLITSRNQDWSSNIIILDIFTDEEAFLFVKKNLPNSKENDINLLIKTLCNYPLALTQAIIYIKKHTNIKDYLQLYRNKKQQYLDTSLYNNEQYTKTLWCVMSITLDMLSDTAKKILYRAAYLSPDQISMKLFDDILLLDMVKGIAELRQHSLISLTNDMEGFSIHRLLQEIVRLKISTNYIPLKKTIDMATNAVKNLNLDSDGAWDEIRHWLHQILFLKQYMNINLETMQILHEYGLVALFFGFKQLSFNLYYAELEIKKKLYTDEDNVKLNNTLNNLGYVKLKLGDFIESKKYLDKALNILEAYYKDPINYNLSTTLSNLGFIELYYGNYETAELLHRRALEGINKYYKRTDHYESYYPLSNLGMIEIFRGSYQEAKKKYLQVYEILFKYYIDPTHVEIGYSLYNLGLTEAALGNYNQSLDYLQRTYLIYSKHYKKRLHENMKFEYVKPPFLGQFI
ncbi:MAG: tetratricopeptide repeat protein, partial [Legionellales bacterium]|nr:tetratricopeptide repeat protein [Legionellales bacterium]